MLIELQQKSHNMAISPIFYVEMRLLMEISSLIICNINLMAEIKKKRLEGGREYVEFRDSLVRSEL